MVIALRDDYDAARLWQAARDGDNAGQVRRLLALAAIYDGVSRADAGQIGGVTRQIVRDWVLRFNADGADGLIDRTAPGKPPLLGPAERAAFAAAIEDGPAPAIDGVVRWRLVDLVQWVWEMFGISISRQTLGRELQEMGYRKLSARPRHHAQAAGAVEAFKKLRRHCGGARADAGPPSQRWSGLVWRRGQGRAEEQDRPPLGATRHPPQRAARSADRVDPHLRRHLPGAGQGGRAGDAVVQYRGDEPPSGRDLGVDQTRAACRAIGRPSRMASLRQPDRARHHHHRRTAGQVPRAEPAPSGTRRRTSGSSCATTGSPTACSPAMTPSSTTAATPGTSASRSLGRSCLSDTGRGLTVLINERWY